jgi:FXSXX-COOH protein
LAARGETVVQTASASVDHFTESLIHVGHEPLERLRPEAVDRIVRRIVRESDEPAHLEVAAFQSSF